MTDYGHELEFGIFPTPASDRAGALLELVQLAEVLGLDMVSLQDHPYQRRHLDTWTLLSVLGARTSTVRLAPNVANLPLRPPVVLAKAVASLDVLTGGRVELGLGAGAFWDAIEAAGGPRRSGKEAVDALVEAIGILRAFWAGGTLRHRGEHYRATGLHAGPRPAHRIPIWLGAYRPRMLRVTGELADAWVPSLGYADPPALPGLNERIDEAAAAAGRAPQDIRRIYNVFGAFGGSAGFLQGTVTDWVEELAGLALDAGIGTFILGTDDPDVVRRFAGEVAPAVRDAVAAERSSPAPGTAATPAAAAPAAVPARDGATGAGPLRVRPTPDSGERLTGEPAWDEAGRPTRPGSSDGEYTAEQQAVPQHLVDVHDALRGELTQLRDVVEQVRRGLLSAGAARSAINAMTLRQNNWTLGAFCQSYCRIVTGHHGLEDHSIFPHLRRAEPGVGPVLDRLGEEHEVIAGVLDRLDRALVDLVAAAEDGHGPPVATSAAPGPSSRERLERLERLSRAVDLLTDTMLSHLSYEERELVGPLARHGFG